jgi:hypothetical protein
MLSRKNCDCGFIRDLYYLTKNTFQLSHSSLLPTPYSLLPTLTLNSGLCTPSSDTHILTYKKETQNIASLHIKYIILTASYCPISFKRALRVIFLVLILANDLI